MHLAQAVGQIFKRKRPVLEIDAALQAGILQRSVRFHLECGDAARGQVGIERLGQLQVDGAAGGQIQLPVAAERQAALRAQVGVFAGHVQRVQTIAAVGQRGVRSASLCRCTPAIVTASFCSRASPRSCSGCASGPSTVTVPASADLPLNASTCASFSSGPFEA